MADKNAFVEKVGVVKESLPDAKFLIQLNDEDREIIAYLSGKMRKAHIRVMPGDQVRVEFSQYDNSNGRIVYRLK